MKPTIVAVAGGKKSGKTSIAEALIRDLTNRGLKIAAVKHINEKHFTIDTKGKDTWRFAQAGAKLIVAVSSNEIATIEKTKTDNISLSMILRKCKGADVVFIEGFKQLVSNKSEIHKIAIVQSEKEAVQATSQLSPVLAFTGPYSTEKLGLGAPYVSLQCISQMADIIERLT